jgi:parallel beta-helix repeat protein
MSSLCNKSYCFFICFVALLVIHPLTVQSKPFVVDDDRIECPFADFTSIQEAINLATNNKKIRICPGDYDEQLIIDKEVNIKADTGAVLSKKGMTQNTTSLETNTPIAAAIVVDSEKGVKIRGLTIDGAGNGLAGDDCLPILVGLYFRSTSGKIRDVFVYNMKYESETLEGCNGGVGMFIQSQNADRNKTRVIIQSSQVINSQKAGIVANGAQTRVKIVKSEIQGSGPVLKSIQYGIQVGFGARGKIKKNTILDHTFAQCSDENPEGCLVGAAAGILVFETERVKIIKNKFGVNELLNLEGPNQVGVYISSGTRNLIKNNTLEHNGLDGIIMVNDRNKAKKNVINDTVRAAFWIEGNSNKVIKNTVDGAFIGIREKEGTGNVFKKNTFTNIGGQELKAYSQKQPVIIPEPVPFAF